MQRMIFGLLLILFALYRPKGLLPAKNRKYNEKELRDGSKETKTAITPDPSQLEKAQEV
jgi:branched-chain amino acid transport system permease protein